jgi:hypothetical protein
MSDDFFKSAGKLILERGNSIVKTEKYMFITQTAQQFNGKMMAVCSSTFKSGFAAVK